MADSLLRLCEQTAPLRIRLLSQRLEFERLSSRPGVRQKKLERLQREIMALDNELAVQMKNFMAQARRMAGVEERQRSSSRMGRTGRTGRGGKGMMSD